ncbi:MAG: DnaJ C-terminal domain-containing protein [Maricaulaceae bacterium]|jgi:DnaJ-class molecular chaperone
MRDPYAVLGLPREADLSALKAAYRRAVKTCHPDIAPGDAAAAARFAAVTRAYEILSAQLDPARRATERARLRVRAPRRGADCATRLTVTIEELVRGADKRVRLGQDRTVIAKIPRGTEPGATLRFSGMGAEGRDGGPPGDGLVTLRLAPDERFTLKGPNIHVALIVSPRRLAAGGFVRAPTPEGDLQVKIPKGGAPGLTLRLRGRGLPARGKRPAGDLFLTLSVAEVGRRRPRARDAAA